MNKDVFSALLSQHNLPQSFVYLAPVLPIVRVMWADGRNQMPERAKLHVLIQQHCKALSRLAGGLEIVSARDIELFDRTFIAKKPDWQLLDELTGLACTVLVGEESNSRKEDRHSLFGIDKLFHACLEIAATCPARKDSGQGSLVAQRIAQEERDLIKKTFELFQQHNPSIPGVGR
jgi:hypothetical protein